jgi:hypothetical protein
MIGRDDKGRYIKGHIHSPEALRKTSATLTGVKRGVGWSKGLTKETDPRIAKMSSGLKGRPSPKKGHPISDEQKRKQSLALTGRKHSAAHKRKISQGSARHWLGKVLPEDARAKMSARKFASWQDADYVKKVMDGRKISPNKAELKLFKLLEKLYPGE